MNLSQTRKTQIVAFHAKGLTVKEISWKTKCTQETIREFLKSLGKEPLEAVKKKGKEPESAATDPSSDKTDVVVDKNTVSMSKCTISKAKSQNVLRMVRKELIEIYNRLSDTQQHAWDLGELHAYVCSVIEEVQE